MFNGEPQSSLLRRFIGENANKPTYAHSIYDLVCDTIKFYDAYGKSALDKTYKDLWYILYYFFINIYDIIIFVAYKMQLLNNEINIWIRYTHFNYIYHNLYHFDYLLGSLLTL